MMLTYNLHWALSYKKKLKLEMKLQNCFFFIYRKLSTKTAFHNGRMEFRCQAVRIDQLSRFGEFSDQYSMLSLVIQMLKVHIRDSSHYLGQLLSWAMEVSHLATLLAKLPLLINLQILCIKLSMVHFVCIMLLANQGNFS